MTPSALYVGALTRSVHAVYLSATQDKGSLDDSHGTLPVSDGAATLEAVGGRDPAQAWRES